MVTDFDGYTHEQLMAMIASIKPEVVRARATQLEEAAIAIKEIGENLKNHKVSGWEGEAATAFQTWVNSAGNATLRLADYSKDASKWMTIATQHMYEAQTTPGVDTSAKENLAAARKFHNDPDSAKIGSLAAQKLEADRLQAVQQLKKLAESYDESSRNMNAAQAPTFPPPPAKFVPGGWESDSSTEFARSGGSSSIGAGPGGGFEYIPATPDSGGSTSDSHRQTHAGSGLAPALAAAPEGHPTAPDRNVNIDLNTVGTLPPTNLPPTGNPPTGPGPVGPGGGPTPVPVVPRLTLPPTSGSFRPVGGGTFQRPTLPPGKLGVTPGLPPSETGIVGGRPVTPRGPSAGIPRGTVIGAEGSQTGGRGMMGGGMGSGVGGSHGGPGSAVGRRLAMEPGGVVGGRQTGVGGQSATSGRPFTQGGSGLVRNGTGAGPVGGAGSHVPGKRQDGRGGERPDYLAEDEETWQADRPVMPPVID
ncbi:WXG100 family type VII secretion target [Streptomyces sp. NPDC091259]|uniref:WXG100 family type VII secretion target n=1 Tax=Streptomyces sp. NPDC091259 TaxID=3365976 RepID=UPI0037F1F538